ncbi:unnamed protein product [Orchesella dallaii]|uniref:Uncharacterized protein n=1 Tax=Orchesella dallaii TaxID=48710 RepID=A0ABP1RIS2_9HEXA
MSVLQYRKILTIVIFTTSQLTNGSWLRLHNELVIFEECTVIVLFNSANTKGTTDDNYLIEPLKFPVILASKKYLRRDDEEESLDEEFPVWKTFLCDGLPFDVEDNQEFMFRSLPPPRRLCSVIVYINPKPCQKWTHGDTELSFQPSNLPFDLMDPIFYYNTEGAEKFTSARVSQFFINLRKHNKAEKDLLKPYYNDVIFLMELFWKSWCRAPAHETLTSPTKLIFTVDADASKNTIVKTYVIESPTHWKYFKRRPLIHESDDDSAYVIIKFNDRNVLSSQLKSPAVFEYSSSRITNLNKLELYGFEFRGSKWFTSPIGVVDEIRSGRKYFLEVTTRGFSPELIILSILSPNSTSASSLHHDHILGAIYPMFVAVTDAHIDSNIFLDGTNNALHFVTCAPYEVSGGLSMSGYVSAFDRYIWILLFASAILSGSTVNLIDSYFHVKIHLEQSTAWLTSKDVFGNASFAYDVLLGQSTKVIHRHKILCGAWILTGIVLTYGYQGSNIEKLSAPIPKFGFENMEQLVAATSGCIHHQKMVTT